MEKLLMFIYKIAPKDVNTLVLSGMHWRQQ